MVAGDSTAWTELGALLRASGYTNESVRGRLGVRTAAERFLSNIGRYSLLHLGDLQKSSDPLSVISRLFLLSGRIPRKELDGLDERLSSLLRRLALVEPVEGDPDAVRGTVQITPYNGRYFLSDQLFENLLHDFVEREDHAHLCMPPHASSLELFRTLRKPDSATSFLDIGCGTGCQSILCAGGYEVMAGFDSSARCVHFAKINAALNGVRAEYRVDTWESFSPGEPYDHVAFNPPATDAAFSFINSRLAEFLAVGGLAQIHVVIEVLADDRTWQGAVERQLTHPGDWRIEATLHRDSPFSLPPEALHSRFLPDDTFLAGHSMKWVDHIRSLHARKVSEVVCATLDVTYR